MSHSDLEKNNIISGTLNYCRIAEKFHKQSKIVFCSSGAVYGFQSQNKKFLKEDSVFGDITRLDDIKKTYAHAKRDAEFAIQDLGKNNLDVAIARCFTFIGKYLPRDQHFAIGNFIEDGLLGNDITIKSNKKVFRSYMHADDLLVWLMTIAENANVSCPIYNVGSDREIEIRELASIVGDIFDVKISSSNNIQNSVDRYIPSTKKAQTELNLTTNYDLKELIMLSSK